MTERPEDEPQDSADEPVQSTPPDEPVESTPPDEPTDAAPEEPVAETASEPDADNAPEPQAESVPEPQAESAPVPQAEVEAAPVPEAEIAQEPEELIAEAEVPEFDPDVIVDAEPNPAEDEELLVEEEVELAPRQKPEIPGADLIPDIVPEGEQFLDAEAQAAAEAEAEEAARMQQDAEEEARPIADAAIDLAAGARYTATGKRKTAVARVIIKPGSGTYVINGKTLDEFFPRETLRRVIRQPLETVGYESRMDVIARMHGGGVSAQAGALRHGVSRALIVADPNLRGELKRRGFLTRDPRVKERKKAGLKKARKRPQFSKR